MGIEGLVVTRQFISAVESNQEISCAICQSDEKLQEKLGEISCKHVFHWKCIDRWLRQSGSCPLCRKATYIILNK